MDAEGVVSLDREVDPNVWREAGKEVGRKLGVVQERKRVLAILQQEQQAWVRQSAFSYTQALDKLMAQIKDGM